MMETMKLALVWTFGLVRFCIVGSIAIHAPAVFANGIRTGELPGAELVCCLLLATLGALLSGIAWCMSTTAELTKHLLGFHVAIAAHSVHFRTRPMTINKKKILSSKKIRRNLIAD
jgi:hypothetical protein